MRIAKIKEEKLIIVVIRDIDHQSISFSLSYKFSSSLSFDIDVLSTMISTLSQIQELDNHFQILETIIDENQREFHSSLQDIFTQFMN